MATTTSRARSNARQGSDASRSALDRRTLNGRRRQLPLVIVGVLLVVGCALAFADASLQAGSESQVLVLVRSVGAGQVVTSADLRAVKLSAPSGVATVPASDEGTVVGEPATAPLAVGALLTRTDVGSSPGIGSGSEIVAVALKPGSYPPDLAAGDLVQVIPVPSSSGTGTPSTATSKSPGVVPATVLAVEPPSATSGSPAVLSLEVARSEAAEVATLAAAGEVALVQQGAGGGSR